MKKKWGLNGRSTTATNFYVTTELLSKSSDAIFVHKSNRELLEWAGALCWFEPETLSAEELKKHGNTAFVQQNYEGKSLPDLF
jgi:hypothetical protein